MRRTVSLHHAWQLDARALQQVGKIQADDLVSIVNVGERLDSADCQTLLCRAVADGTHQRPGDPALVAHRFRHVIQNLVDLC